MKKYKIRLDELVKVWQQTYITVEAESFEDILKMIEDKTILEKEWIDLEVGEFYLETTENLDWDFDSSKIFEID